MLPLPLIDILAEILCTLLISLLVLNKFSDPQEERRIVVSVGRSQVFFLLRLPKVAKLEHLFELICPGIGQETQVVE